MKIMKRNNLFIFQLIALLCGITICACSGIDDEFSMAIKANEGNSYTRTNLIEYTINVETAGTLGSIVEAGNYSNAQKLIVTGNISYDDVHYVDVNMPSVEVLDLSGTKYYRAYISGSFLSESSNIKEI
jgi:hypothetical protein